MARQRHVGPWCDIPGVASVGALLRPRHCQIINLYEIVKERNQAVAMSKNPVSP